MAALSLHLSAIYCQTKPMVSCHFLYYLTCLQSPRIVKIYSNLPAMWLTYCRGEHSPARMTAALSTHSADPAPISFSSHFYTAALNQRARRGRRRRGESSSEWKWPLWKRPWKMGRPPVYFHWRQGHQKSSALLQQRILMIPWRLEQRAGALTSL